MLNHCILAAGLLFAGTTIQAEVGPDWLEQWGIRWTFDKSISTDGSGGTYQYGTYVNGDYWIKGPLNLVGITPQSTIAASRQLVNTDGDLMNSYALNTFVNGSMVNPAVASKQGYDSDAGGYDTISNINFPNISPGNPYFVNTNETPIQSIISTISLENPFEGVGRPHLKTAAILTVVADTPSADAFRPPYNGNVKCAEIRASAIDLQTTPLGNVLPTAAKPWTCPSGMSNLAWAETITQRVWLHHIPDWTGHCTMPQENVNQFFKSYVSYSRDFGRWMAEAALVLNTNTGADKTVLMHHIVQRGIDLYGTISERPGLYTNDGGGQSGRALPFAIAAYLLNHAGMKDMLSHTGQYRYTSADAGGRSYWPTRPTPGYVDFGELDQVHYVTKEDAYITVGRYQIQVTGTGLSPNIAGVYTRGAEINARPAYYRTSVTSGTAGVSGFADGPVLYYDPAYGWVIFVSASFSGTVSSRWEIADSVRAPFGTYGPALNASGSAVVDSQQNQMEASPWRPDLRGAEQLPYREADIGLPEWGIRNATYPSLGNKAWEGATYRTVAGPPFPGTALVAYIMGMKDLFNHPAFFDYADRYVSMQGGAGTTWLTEMWNVYRTGYSCVYTGLDTLTHERQYADCASGVVTKSSRSLSAKPWSGLTVFPNPMKNKVTINVETCHGVSLPVIIYNRAGNMVRTIEAIHKTPLRWDGNDRSGRMVEPGIYYITYADQARIIIVIK